MRSAFGGKRVWGSWAVPMMTVPPPGAGVPSRPPHAASSASDPTAARAPRHTERNRLSLREYGANITRLDAPRPLRPGELPPMRRREAGRLARVERLRFAFRCRERGAQRIANGLVGGRVAEARAKRRRRTRRRQRLQCERRDSRLVVVNQDGAVLQQRAVLAPLGASHRLASLDHEPPRRGFRETGCAAGPARLSSGGLRYADAEPQQRRDQDRVDPAVAV